MSMVPMEVVAEPGAPVIVVKRAGPGPDAAQLAHEAEVLDAVRGPGVVELLGFDADDDGAELRMAWAGHHTLATIGRIPVLAAADLVATVAETVARLHDLRVGHTRLTADHVVLGPDQRPLLCGFGRACRGDLSALDSDVVALGDLLALLLGHGDAPPVLVPERRALRRGSEPERPALLTLADRASAEGLGGRPSAATFAEAIRTLVTGAQPDPRRPRLPNRRALRRLAPLVGGALGAVLVLAIARELIGDRVPTRAPDEASQETAPIGARDERGATPPGRPTTTRSESPASTAPPVPPVAPVACPTEPAPSADVDGDGCADRYTVTGSHVIVDGRTYEVGRTDDLVAVADWDCDGRATPALVRPRTGEVFVFARWADPTDPLTVPASTVVHGATGIRAARGGRCPQLVVTRQDGEPVLVKGRP